MNRLATWLWTLAYIGLWVIGLLSTLLVGGLWLGWALARIALPIAVAALIVWFILGRPAIALPGGLL